MDKPYPVSTNLREELANRFLHHAALPGSTQIERYNEIRGKGLAMAVRLNEVCPNSRELSIALTNLEQAVIWAIEAIARNEKPQERSVCPPTK